MYGQTIISNKNFMGIHSSEDVKQQILNFRKAWYMRDKFKPYSNEIRETKNNFSTRCADLLR